MATPMMNILQGDPLDTEEQPPPTTAREVVARVPTLGVVGGPPAAPARAPEPVAAPQEAQVAAVAPTPAPGREMAQQGAQVAPAPPKFKLPPVDQMVNDYQRWTMMAADPDVARELAPRLNAWKNLTMQQHAAAFDGDPMESPEKAAAYARHMGQISGRLGQPMKWEEAANIAEYTEGRKAKMPTRFLQGMNSYDQTLVKPLVDDVFGADWEMVSLAPSKTRVGDSEMDVPTLTIRNARTGEVRPVSVFDAEAAFGNLEGRLKITKLNRERDLQAAQADLDLARANKDPAAAAAAFERITELKGGSARKPKGDVNPQEVRAYLQEKGVPPAHIAGILANIEGESGFSSSIGGDNGTSYGLFQHHNERRTNLFKHAGTQSPSWQQQVDYALQEPEMRAYLAQSHADGPTAAKHFVEVFEKPKDKAGAQAERARLARKYEGSGEDRAALGERLVAMPIGSTNETLSRGTPALVAQQAKDAAAYRRDRVKIMNEDLGEKEEQRRLDKLDQIYGLAPGREGAPMPTAANPPGMPVQPPGAAGKPKTDAQAAAQLRTDEDLQKWFDANVRAG